MCDSMETFVNRIRYEYDRLQKDNPDFDVLVLIDRYEIGSISCQSGLMYAKPRTGICLMVREIGYPMDFVLETKRSGRESFKIGVNRVIWED